MPFQKPPFFSWVVLKQLCIDTAGFLHVATLSLMPFNLGAAVFFTAVQTCYRDYSINFLVYLFIYLFINFAKRPGSLTEQPPLQVPEEKKRRKLVIQLTRMTILRNDKKRNANAKTEFGRTLIKKSTTHTILLSKLFNGWLVWHLIHTLLKISMYITEKVMRVTEKIF